MAKLSSLAGDVQALKACIAAAASGSSIELSAASQQPRGVPFSFSICLVSTDGGVSLTEPNAAAMYLAGNSWSSDTAGAADHTHRLVGPTEQQQQQFLICCPLAPGMSSPSLSPLTAALGVSSQLPTCLLGTHFGIRPNHLNRHCSLLHASAGSALQAPQQQQAEQDRWLLWEASVLRPATYSSNTAEPLSTLEAALSKSSSGLLLGSAGLSLADVSGGAALSTYMCLQQQGSQQL
jgi:hypothetical protein